MIYKLILRPLFFLFPPEKAHNLVFALLEWIFRIPGSLSLASRLNYRSPSLKRQVFGIDFPNPVGLAAGLDKNARLVDAMGALGFGFVEIGTVTPLPQPGNPLPRMFRLPADQALINRMGFNNDGAVAVQERLKKVKGKVIVGGNIGKNKNTPNELAVDDYLKSFAQLFDQVDYFVVNVSSPNTPGLRDLQEKEPLKKILMALMDQNRKRTVPKPVLLKIAPDLTETQLDDIVEIVTDTGLNGIIATNTTISRENLTTSASEVNSIGAGGLSGKPLKDRSTEIIRYLHQKSEGKIPLVAVGGIHSAEDAAEKLKAGAALVQLYTGFIYEGPSLISKINRFLDKH